MGPIIGEAERVLRDRDAMHARLTGMFKPKCRCVWHGVHCDKTATQEDGLCDWCGTRTPEMLRDNPNAMWGIDDPDCFIGLGGGTESGYNHQAGWGPIPSSVRPTACWMPDSGRTLHCLDVHGLGCERGPDAG